MGPAKPMKIPFHSFSPSLNIVAAAPPDPREQDLPFKSSIL
jgi:hypothetical protein